MILYRWQGQSTNFGDELNTLLWPRLLPDLFDVGRFGSGRRDDSRCDASGAVRFLGIGSVLDARHPAQPVKLVAGSGYGGYERKPRLDETWIIHWVRGPRTAATLGLPARLALGDPAVLVPPALGLERAEGQDVGFMPHFENAAWGAWQQAAELAGVRLIDPRMPPLGIIHAIRGCKLLLSEALHGVIVADALRVPWIAIQPSARIHRPKWGDWADTMDLRPRFHRLPASTLLEWVRTSRLGSCHRARSWLDRRAQRPPKLSPERLVARAGRALRVAADGSPQLSTATALDRCQSRMLDAVNMIRANPLRAPLSLASPSPIPCGVHRRSYPRAREDCAYDLGSVG